MLDKFNFNHDASDFVEALGFKKEDHEYARMVIQYEILAPMIATGGDSDEGIELNGNAVGSRSLLFERCLKRLGKADNHIVPFLMVFNIQYNKVKDSLDNLVQYQKDHENGRNMEHLLESGSIQGESIGDALNKLKTMLTIRPIIESIHFLQQSKCDFNKFIAFTVNGVSMQDALDGKTTPSEPEDDDDEDDDIPSDFKRFLLDKLAKKFKKDSSEEKPKKKDFSDIDEIIKRALENKDDDEKES